MQQRLARSEATDIFLRNRQAAYERFGRQPRDMRREHHIGQSEQWIATRQRLLGEDVEPGTAQMARPQRLDQPCLVNQLAEIGRASCRERVCQYVSISVVAVSLKKNIHT